MARALLSPQVPFEMISLRSLSRLCCEGNGRRTGGGERIDYIPRSDSFTHLQHTAFLPRPIQKMKLAKSFPTVLTKKIGERGV